MSVCVRVGVDGTTMTAVVKSEISRTRRSQRHTVDLGDTGQLGMVKSVQDVDEDKIDMIDTGQQGASPPIDHRRVFPFSIGLMTLPWDLASVHEHARQKQSARVG